MTQVGLVFMWSGVNHFHEPIFDIWLYDFPPWEALKKGQRRISLSQLHEVRCLFPRRLVVELVTCTSTWRRKFDVVDTLPFFESVLKEFSIWTPHISDLCLCGSLMTKATWSFQGSPVLWCDLRGARPLTMWPPKKEPMVSVWERSGAPKKSERLPNQVI